MFLDNLAFIDYYNKLADNCKVYYFQVTLFCRRISIKSYIESLNAIRKLPESVARQILAGKENLKKQKRVGNVFKVANKLGLI